MLNRFVGLVTLAVVSYVLYLGLVPGFTDVILQDKPQQQSVIEDFVWAVTEGVATGDVGQKVAEEEASQYKNINKDLSEKLNRR